MAKWLFRQSSPNLPYITPIIEKLHWLPVKSRIKYKILLLTYKSLHVLAPQCP